MTLPTVTTFLAQTPLPEIQFPGLEKVVAEIEILPLAACVLITLVMLGCVFRWLGRGRLLREVREADGEFTRQFRSSAHALALFQESAKTDGSPRSALYMNACRELAFHLLGTDTVDKNFSLKLRAAGRISPTQWLAVERAGKRSVDESARWLRSRLHGAGVRSLLTLGVLGMVLALWERLGTGTLDAAAVGSASRPLVLALFFHLIGTAWHRRVVRRADDAVTELDDFAVELGTLFDRSFVDHHHPMESLPSLGSMGMNDGPTFSLPPSEPGRRVVR